MKIVKERDGSKMTHEFEETTPEKRPQDPCGDGTGLVFKTLEHGGPDTMPQAIRVTDAESRSCIYVPITVDGKVVDSKGFSLEPAVVQHADEEPAGKGLALLGRLAH